MYIRFIIAPLMLLLVFSVGNAEVVSTDVTQQVSFPVTKYKLKNGMTVLLHEDHRAPMVSVHQWFRVGSRNERPGRTGLAHFFEHLMFKGTKKFSSEDFEGLIKANGGTNNAFTSFDYTGYFVDLPSKNLEIILNIESDRMVNLLFDAAAIQSEREVVKEERRMRFDNSVQGALQEATFSSVFKVHNYRWPVIGYMKDLNATSMEDFKKFYKTYYSPNNSVLVIAGDFKTSRVKKLVKKYYGDLETQELPKVDIPAEPVQKSLRRKTLRKNVQNVSLAVAYQSVAAGDDEQYAFDILANILGEGRSSRLYNRLVYKTQLASSVSSWAYTPKDPGVFSVNVSMKPGKSYKRALREVEKQIARLRTGSVTEKELEKAKNQLMMSYVNSLKTISGKARGLASNEILFGDYSYLFKDIAKYQSVTAQQVQAVAKKYLKPSQRSILTVIPK